MPTHKGTYRVLYNMQFNLLDFRYKYWALSSISDTLQKEVRRFENFNRIALKHLQSKQYELYGEHVETEVIQQPDGSYNQQYIFVEPSSLHIAGQPQRNYIHTGIDGRVPKFLSAEHEEKFNVAWEQLMNTEVSITS